ncbi:MAG: hypothetical protein NZ522_04340, partial [Chitinophagales bacterium]|nr:hypothetical protein [Chitinophagales bacterium]
MYIRYFLTACSLFYGSLIAQEKQMISLRDRMYFNRNFLTDKTTGLLVEGDEQKVAEACRRFDGWVKFTVGNIHSVEIPTLKVLDFAHQPGIYRIETISALGNLMMDTARIQNNIDSAHLGFVPLTSGYSGKGVIVGIIDGGIYWQHPDFKNPDGSTRIRFIWDQL